MDKQYTFKDLIFVYMESLEDRPSWASEELKNYYPSLLSHLQTYFQIKIDSESIGNFDKKVLFMLFQSSISSYKAIRTPWSSYPEATLLVNKVEDLGETGKKIMFLSDEIYKLCQSNKELHLKIVYELFISIYGLTNVIVTSAQLLEAGFDDSKEPKPWDFE